MDEFNEVVTEAVPQEGVNEVPAAEEQQSTENDKVDSAFAKRLSSAQEKWNAEKEAQIKAIKEEYEGKFKDHDVYKKVAEYTQRTSGIADMLTVTQEIELQELQERAEQSNLTPSQQKDMEELLKIRDEWKEMKSQSEQQAKQQEEEARQQQEFVEFENKLKEFATGKEFNGKPLDHTELWKFMHERGVGDPEVAFEAMEAPLLREKLASSKGDSIKEYLSSKYGVKTKSEGYTAQALPENKKGFAGVEERLIAQMRSDKTKI